MLDKTKHINSKETPVIGEGVFLSKDVANILKLPYTKVRNLMKGFWHSAAFGDDKNLAINFYSLIEFYTFYQLRLLDVPASEIKKAHSILAKELKVKYPFALSGIRTDGKKVWYETLENLIRVDGKNQFAIREFITKFLHKIEFGENNIAKCFYPIPNSKLVVVDPKHQFGQPTITGKNINISTIKKLYDGGETPQEIASLYDIKISQVTHALEYYKLTA
jgi:uncharacterized protein (DUF433 family)